MIYAVTTVKYIADASWRWDGAWRHPINPTKTSKPHASEVADDAKDGKLASAMMEAAVVSS